LSSFSAPNCPHSTPTTHHRPKVLRFEPRFAQNVSVETRPARRLRRRGSTGCTALSATLITGGPMEQGPMPMGNEFGGLTPEPPPGFLQQPPPTNEQLISQRSSPEFIGSQGEYQIRRPDVFV
jgi:hypothetical protein